MNNKFYQQSKDDLLISTDPSLIQIESVHNYLTKESYWAEKIPRTTVERALKTLCVLGYIEILNK